MRALILAAVLTFPQLGQQQCYWDCPGQPFWERQAQQDTQERLRQIETREVVNRLWNFDQPRGTSRSTTPSIWDCPTCTR